MEDNNNVIKVKYTKEELKEKRREWLELANQRRKEKALNGELKTNGKKKKREEFEKVARSKFLNIVLPALKQLAIVSRDEAKNPANFNERKYLLDQIIGKPAEMKEVSVQPQQLKDLSDNIKALADESPVIVPDPNKHALS